MCWLYVIHGHVCNTTIAKLDFSAESHHHEILGRGIVCRGFVCHTVLHTTSPKSNSSNQVMMMRKVSRSRGASKMFVKQTFVCQTSTPKLDFSAESHHHDLEDLDLHKGWRLS